MRPCLLGPLRFGRRYSAIANSQARNWDYFSLVVKGNKGHQAQVIDKLRQYVAAQHEKQQWSADPEALNSSLVLLASRDLAPWLEDGQFMSDFLGSLQVSKNGKGNSTVDVLSGVTEGLNPYRKYGQPRSGFSVLYGAQDILPRLWEQEDAEAGQNNDRAASISLSTAFAGNPFNSHVTIPLANTIFQNGRRSTLFATRYETNSSGRVEATLMREKSHQDIEFITETGPIFEPQLPLVPLAPPRKIVAGLGNIVRQVEIDGIASPASKELEILIPQLLERRQIQGAVGVWAVVIPPQLMESKVFAELKPFSDYVNDENTTELKLLDQNSQILEGITQYGFRIHKILSGGGGWGAKQGLLSLDPDASYTRPDQDNIDDFIKAFEQRNSQDSSHGIATPGSYILFCAQPDVSRATGQVPGVDSGLYFGVSEKTEDALPHETLREAGDSDVSVIPQLFSAMSSEGVYLKLDTPGHKAAIQSYPFTTKIDVPNAYLRHSGF